MNTVPPPGPAAPAIVISSHVVRGSVGNRAAVFALEALGHPVWAVPTVFLPWHPGHGPATRIVQPEAAFADLIEDLAGSKWRSEVAAVLTGYMGSAEQVKSAARLITSLKQENPDLLYVCDPVIGDARAATPNGDMTGALYVPEAVASAIRDHLIPICDVVTPNLFELCWLSGNVEVLSSTLSPMEIVAMARGLQPPRVIVTSAPGMMRGTIANIAVDPDLALMAEHPVMDRVPNGTGDLTSALVTSHLMDGLALSQVLERASASVFEVLARTAKSGSDELMLQRERDSLVRPLAMVQMRKLTQPLTPKKAKPSALPVREKRG